MKFSKSRDWDISLGFHSEKNVFNNNAITMDMCVRTDDFSDT